MEMQRRAKSTVEGHPASARESMAPAPKNPPEKPAAKHSFLEMLNLKSFLEGKDTSLVLMVLALLNAEESDPLLMLALLYIIM